MADFTVSTDIDTLLQSADNAAARVAIGADVRTDANGAFSAGDLGGNARGVNAINIQSARNASPQVASGGNSIAIGTNSTASGDYCSASGYNAKATNIYCTASGYYSTASGAYSTASGYNAKATAFTASAFGNNANASGTDATAVGANAQAISGSSTAMGKSASASGAVSTAVGNNANASGYNSTAVGKFVKTTVANTTEIGFWSSATVRAGAVRVHSTGMVAQTIQNRSTAYGDGGATKGSEADNTVIREGIALRRNGNEILVDLNIAGTVTTLSLGTAS